MKKVLGFIPGFRSGVKWKMIVSSIYYAFSLFMLLAEIGAFLFLISIPFLIFGIIKTIKTRENSAVLSCIIAGIVMFLSIDFLLNSEVGSTKDASVAINKNENKKPEETKAPEATATPTPTKAPEPTKAPAKPKYEILEHKSEGDKYTRYVTGKIKNNSGKNVTYIQVEINLYDKDGNQIGSTFDNVNNLEKDGVWVFKAIILEDNTASYKIKDVTGF